MIHFLMWLATKFPSTYIITTGEKKNTYRKIDNLIKCPELGIKRGKLNGDLKVNLLDDHILIDNAEIQTFTVFRS